MKRLYIYSGIIPYSCIPVAEESRYVLQRNTIPMALTKVHEITTGMEPWMSVNCMLSVSMPLPCNVKSTRMDRAL